MAGFLESGWLPLSFLKGKMLVVLSLDGPLATWTWSFVTTLLNLPSWSPWWPSGNLNTFSPVDPPSGRLPLLLIAWKVHHRSNPSWVLLHDLGENSQERKLLMLANTLRGGCPSLTQFPYQPSIIGIVLDLVHQVLSRCYNIHPKLSAHHLRLCQYQSFGPILQDNLARILWHGVRGCDPYILHIDT